ncbi:macro domain-containing protein [Nocardiopsis terrae]
MRDKSPPEKRSSKNYRIGGKRLNVTFGRLEESHSEALVSSDDNYLSMGGGVSASLRENGGSQVISDAQKHIPLRLGDIAVTSAGDLPSKYIFHGVTIDHDELKNADSECIKNITKASLQTAETLNLKSISFPALGTGLAGLSYERSSEALTLAIVEFLSLRSKSVQSVDLIIYPREESELHPSDIFYTTAAQLATQWTDIKKLRELIGSVQKIAPAYNLEKTNSAIKALYEEVSQAASLFDFSSPGEENENTISRELQPISKLVSEITSTQSEYSQMPDETPAVLRLRLQSLRTQVNIMIGNINQLEEKKAKYGPLSTPLEIENSISIINREIREKEGEIQEITKRLS